MSYLFPSSSLLTDTVQVPDYMTDKLHTIVTTEY